MRPIRLLPDNLDLNRPHTPDQASGASPQILDSQWPRETYDCNYVCPPPKRAIRSVSTTQSVTPRLLRVKEAARYRGVSSWKIKQMVHSGRLRVIADTGRSPWLIDIRDLDKDIEESKITY